MKTKYYVDVFDCPKCGKRGIGKMYFGLFALAKITAAKRAGLIVYTCNRCGASCRPDCPPIAKDAGGASGRTKMLNWPKPKSWTVKRCKITQFPNESGFRGKAVRFPPAKHLEPAKGRLGGTARDRLRTDLS